MISLKVLLQAFQRFGVPLDSTKEAVGFLQGGGDASDFRSLRMW